MELLGKSLETIFGLSSKKFSLKSVCVIAIEMVKYKITIILIILYKLDEINSICS